ncbi:MAG TPA: haloacid dehalogenase type II [Terriglobales bacterium]|nr:haloacid dehalogenase type II [Terriglobales bacterium]
MLDFSKFACLTFDCYGTLIDWESGILAALKPLLANHHREMGDEKLLELYGTMESQIQAGDYMTYRHVLQRVAQKLGARLSFPLYEGEIDTLPNSMKSWPSFPDTVEALKRLKSRYKLAIVSNTDDDLFAETAKTLQVPFDFVITAEQVRSYKPSHNNFERALERIGLPKEKVLHCAQSIYHDIVPAKALGFSTVWVNRRAGKAGGGATRPAQETPDLTVTSLKELADAAGV